MPELQTTHHTPRTKPAVEAPTARDHSEWRDGSEWIPAPKPASEPAANHAKPAGEPSAKQAEPASEPSADREDRFTPHRKRRCRRMPTTTRPPGQPNADPETIHRVYRIMAARFHPDNPTTGSLERFLLLREAYQTLSDRRCAPSTTLAVRTGRRKPCRLLAEVLRGWN